MRFTTLLFVFCTEDTIVAITMCIYNTLGWPLFPKDFPAYAHHRKIGRIGRKNKCFNIF